MKRCNLLSLLTLALVPSLTQADELLDIYMEMDIDKLLDVNISSATGSDKPLRSAPAIATVITAKEIERSSARTLSEVLQLVPGLYHYLAASLLIQKDSYDIRGVGSKDNSQLLMLINGQPINNITFGTTSAAFIFPASLIQQVEVIRGPGSAIFGADAFAGVINIITKDPYYLEQRAQNGVRYGDFDTTELFANNAYQFNNGATFGLNLSWMTSNGDANRIIDYDLQSEFDELFGSNASQAPGRFNDQYQTLHVSSDLHFDAFKLSFWGYRNFEQGTNAGQGNALDNIGEIKETKLLTTLTHTQNWNGNNEWNNNLIFSYNNLNNFIVTFPKGAILPINDDGYLSGTGSLTPFPYGFISAPLYIENRFGYESTLHFNNSDNHKIRFSAGIHHIDANISQKKNYGLGVVEAGGEIGGEPVHIAAEYNFIHHNKRTIVFTSIQDEYRLTPHWSLTAGLRYDNFSDIGDSFSPRAALLWDSHKTLSGKLLYGHAYRAPTFYELYSGNAPKISDNPKLKPEKLDSIELSISYRPSDTLHNSTNLYWYQAEELICQRSLKTDPLSIIEK